MEDETFQVSSAFIFYFLVGLDCFEKRHEKYWGKKNKNKKI